MRLEPNKLRAHVIDMVFAAGSGHIGGSFSIAEIIACLFSEFDLVSDRQQRDKLILSKGHAIPIVYAALHELGLLEADELTTFRQMGSRLQGHPDHRVLPLLDATTGSLGQGLSIAIGHALALKLHATSGQCGTVFCIMGDGEMQEGQVWEAAMFAPKYGLDNLVCIVDANGSQNDGLVKDTLDIGDVCSKFRSFGWLADEIDGNDTIAVTKALHVSPSGCPRCIVANTTKGAGVSFMQDTSWHARVPTDEERRAALLELGCGQ